MPAPGQFQSDPLNIPFGPTNFFEMFVGPQVPDPITFVLGEDWLNRPHMLYPRQATLLKVIFLRDDLFCADEQTQILTRRGWKSYWDVIEGEDVMTITDKGDAEWSPAQRINVFDVESEPLVRMDGDGHSSLTTHNHRWLSNRWDHKTRSRSLRFVETKDLRPTDSIPCAAPVMNLPATPVWSDAMVELVAWYWTEGTAIVGHKGGIKIGQSNRVNPLYVERIRRCLTEVFGPASDYLVGTTDPAWSEESSSTPGMTYFRLNSAASVDLKHLAPGAEKVVSASFLSSLTQDQLDLYVETSICADGWVKNGCRQITQKSAARIDSFQMACSLAGLRTVVRRNRTKSGRYAGSEHWLLSIYDRRTHFSVQPKTGVKESKSRKGFAVEMVEHTGQVWCPTTKNGTWLARRDGKVYFTGNTDYDRMVIAEWEETYRLTGKGGISPGTQYRIDWLKAEGARWFREVLLVMGRRAGKGYVSGVAISYVLWHYLALGNPQEHYGIDRDKRISCLVFAGKRDQAKATVFGDVVNAISSSSCFAPYISKSQTESLTLYAPSDFLRLDRMRRKGIKTQRDIASLEILPKESTPMAGRGPSSCIAAFDEMAHVVTGSGSARSADEVYDAVKPSLDQFAKDAFLIEPSSPWQQMGKFYDNYLESIQTEEDGTPTRPNYLSIQLASWEIYKDWERSEEIPVFPEGYEGDLGEYKDKPHPKFPKIKRAIQVFDDEMRREKAANPETFAVEREAQWASTVDAYLNAEKVDEVFAPWEGRPAEYGPPQLFIQTSGLLKNYYVGHADPSKINDKFGYCLGHTERDAEGRLHAVIDQVGHFDPADFEDHIINYEYVDNWIWDNLITKFYPEEFTFDQYSSGPSIQKLMSRVRQASFPKRVSVFEQTATRARDWEIKEQTKAAINMGLVHAPMNERLRDEMKFVQLVNGRVDHPTSGPVQSKDIFDSFTEVVSKLIGEQTKELVANGLSQLRPTLNSLPTPFPQMNQGGFDPQAEDVFNRLRGGSSDSPRFDPTQGGVWRGRERR